MKKTIITGLLVLAALAGFALLRTYDGLFAGSEDSPYTITEGEYDADPWYEKTEHDGYTVTKYMTMDSPSVIVEFFEEEYPVSVTITRGSKTTLVYAPDYLSYDMYISYKNDTYFIEDDFANIDTVVSHAFDWSGDTFMGTYYEEDTGSTTTDEDGNVLYTDPEGNTQVYRYEDEIE